MEDPHAYAARATGASVRDWHVGPIFADSLGYHQYVVEFLVPPSDPRRFRNLLDEDLSRRNAEYQAHRIPGIGLPSPALRVARPGVLEELDASNAASSGGKTRSPEWTIPEP